MLKVTIFINPRRVKLWVLARLKSPPTMNRLLERRWDEEVIKVSKKRSYVGVGDIRGDVHICNNNMIEFRKTWGLTFNGESFDRIYVI